MFFIEVKCYHFFTNMGPLGHYHIWFCGGFDFHSLITRILSVFFLLLRKVDSFRSFLLHLLPRRQMCLCWCGNLRPKIKVFRTVSFMLNAIFPSWQISWEFPASSSFVIISFRFLHTFDQILQINKERKPCSSHGACPICPNCLSVSISILFSFYINIFRKGSVTTILSAILIRILKSPYTIVVAVPSATLIHNFL